MKKKIETLSIIAIVLSLCWLLKSYAIDRLDLSDRIVSLGNPLARDGQVDRALNVWDLQVYNGKLYLAGGSTVTNSGPINVWAYNPSKQSFDKEYTVDEEAIEHFKVFDNELYIPAADPRSGDSNKFYRQSQDGIWRKYVSDRVTLAHVRDLIQTNTGDILMVGNNREIGDLSKSATAIVDRTGDFWRGAGLDKIPKEIPVTEANWFFSVFSYQDNIYASSSLLRDYFNLPGAIAKYNYINQKFELDLNLRNDEFIPKTKIQNKLGKRSLDIIYRIWNPIEFKHYLIYPVKSYSYTKPSYQKAYMNSLGFYVKKELGKTPILVQFPDRQSLGEDVMAIDGELYALANRKINNYKFIVYVYKTREPNNNNSWQELFHFQSPNLARSFTYLDSQFYFGLGQNYGDLISKSGEILTLKQQIDLLEK